MATVSTLLLLCLTVRRVFRNRIRKKQLAKTSELNRILSVLIAKEIIPTPGMLPKINRIYVEVLISVLLQYFRNLSSGKVAHLAKIVEIWDIESKIATKGEKSRRGTRIQALTVLSHLGTESSIAAILNSLKSKDPYIRLAANRCLARRNAHEYLPEVIESLNTADQNNKILLTDILQRFGRKATWAFEELVRIAKTDAICEAALGALKSVGVEKLSFPLEAYLEHSSPAIRAAAVDLIPVYSGDRLASIKSRLQDISPIVRSKAIRRLPDLNFVEALSMALPLLDDPVWRVRYDAHQTMIKLGTQGAAYLRAVSTSNSADSGLAAAVLVESKVA